jgi:crossover junction endodeoxyribonuclease RuvC
MTGIPGVGIHFRKLERHPPSACSTQRPLAGDAADPVDRVGAPVTAGCGRFAQDRPRVYHQDKMARPIRILGIDPGLRRTGWGIIEITGNQLAFLGCGSVTTNDRAALAARLLVIHDGLMRVLDEFRPDEAAVETTFVNKDATATLKLGQARGIAMVVPAKAGVPVAEYAPNLVKKSIVGSGHGDKVQVRMMIGVLLPKADPATHDAADALAIAVTHAHHRQSVVLKMAAE